MSTSDEQLEQWNESGHLVEIQQFDTEMIEDLFDTTSRFRHDYRPGIPVESTTVGLSLAIEFFESSRRTFRSFSQAGHRLGMHVEGVLEAGEYSATAKGENTYDATRTLNELGYDIIVMRHHTPGELAVAANASTVPVINAGDGGRGQHPSQSILDLYTIKDSFDLDNDLEVAMVGDLHNGRTARTLAYLLGKYPNKHINFISKPDLRIGSNILSYLDRHSVGYEEKYEETQESLAQTLSTADVVYMLRTQLERGSSNEGDLVLTELIMNSLKPSVLLGHPFPRNLEIPRWVDELDQARYFEMIANGVWTRMALMNWSVRQNQAQR